MQGGADEGTPSRELGDTYSVSTDPSGDEADTKGISTYQADSMEDATSSQSDQVKTNAKDPPEGLSPHPKQVQKDQQISADASGTQDTQHDPAEDAAMQEGEHSLLRMMQLQSLQSEHHSKHAPQYPQYMCA